MNVEVVIRENEARKKRIYVPYDPMTGEGGVGERVRVEVSDAPTPVMWLPKQMIDSTEVCRRLVEHGSIEAFYRSEGIALTEDEYISFWMRFCELRIKFDYEYFAFMYQTIEAGGEQGLIPFRLKRGQRKALSIILKMWFEGTPIRIIILKARQMGLSTLVQLFMNWIQIVHRTQWHSVICAHVADSSVNIRAMYDRVIKQMPLIGGQSYTMGPFENRQNIKIVHQRQCRITIGTAQEPDSVRGQNPKLVHFSEVAMYPNTTKKGTADLVGGIVSAVKFVPMSMIAYESTAKGVGDYFHSLWEKSKKGESSIVPIFLPWYYDDTYSVSIDGWYYNHGGKQIKGNISAFVDSMNDYERNLFENHPDCTLENIHWYRVTKSGMISDEYMFQEFPSDDIEAFQDSGLPAFRAQDIEAMRSTCKDPAIVGELKSDALASEAKTRPEKRNAVLSGISFVEDKQWNPNLDPETRHRREYNKLKIWEMPDPTIKVSDRYLVVFDPQKGLSDKADFGVIAVFDRYWMMYGGKPEIVAQWRGRKDKDVTIWMAAQIAKWYCNALLVVESNVYDSNKEDDTEFVFDTIRDYYDNFYCRTPADKIIEGYPAKYGFRMGRPEKIIIKDNFVTMLREKGYIERDDMALDEARIYGQQPNGGFEPKPGGHDDILDTRMIGCHICYDMPMPVEIKTGNPRPRRVMVGESSI